MNVDVETEPEPARPAEAEPDRVKPDPPENPAAVAFRVIPQLIAELRSYALHYLNARIDGIKLSVRSAVIYAILGVVGLLVVAGVLVTAVALLLVGIAHALGALLGNRLWLGDIIVGVLLLGTAALAVYVPLKRMSKASRLKTEQKYEGKRIQQRVQHGRDASERARDASPGKSH